jgi:hypothetical protein
MNASTDKAMNPIIYNSRLHARPNKRKRTTTMRTIAYTILFTLVALSAADRYLCHQLIRETRLQRESEAMVEATEHPAPMVPAYIENIVDRYRAGLSIDEFEALAFNTWIKNHQPEWEAWTRTQADRKNTF